MIDPRVIEPIAARGWPAAESAELGGWRLHASAGHSGRINTCWALEPPDRAIERRSRLPRPGTRRAGWRRGSRSSRPTRASLDLIARLPARGYVSDTPTLTMAGPLAGELDPDAIDRRQDLRRLRPRLRRSVVRPRGGRRRAPRRRWRASPPPRGFALIRRDGAPAAVGACAVDGEWAGVMGMRTAPAFRRQGLARRLFRTLTAFAASAGARARATCRSTRTTPRPSRSTKPRASRPEYLYRYWSRPHR